MRHETLAYRRYTWLCDTNLDIERVLCRTGVSVYDTETKRPYSVTTSVDNLDPSKPVRLTYTREDGSSVTAQYPWTALIIVAPAKKLCRHLDRLAAELDKSELVQTVNARVTKVIKTRDKTKEDVQGLVNGTYAGTIPAIDISSDFLAEDVLALGDGETHAQGLNEMHDVALRRVAQDLGVHIGDTTKAERLITDEVEKASDYTDIVHRHEWSERVKLATWLGCTVVDNELGDSFEGGAFND